jgi:hypothetical protein
MPPAVEPEAAGSGLSTDAVTELRNMCLARLEPAAVAAMPAERLTVDVERLFSEIATDRRIQLNARERTRWPANWCTTSWGSVRSNRCLRMSRSTTSW